MPACVVVGPDERQADALRAGYIQVSARSGSAPPSLARAQGEAPAGIADNLDTDQRGGVLENLADIAGKQR